jgi:hypothetical protein
MVKVLKISFSKTGILRPSYRTHFKARCKVFVKVVDSTQGGK